MLEFQLIADITEREVIARGSRIRDLARLRGRYGTGAKWRKCKGRAKVERADGSIVHCGSAWVRSTKHWQSRNENQTGTVLDAETRFVICIENEEYRASLERFKLYMVLPDGEPALGFIRVVDESGEDYLYLSSAFVEVTLPQPEAETLYGLL